MTDRPPCVLSIAGSDSGGGAGIQADLKAFARAGVYGMTAITAITAQNTTEVRDVHPIPPEMIISQVIAVAEDIGVDAVKIGMLGTRATIEAVNEALDHLPFGTPVVLDPVMVAESGAVLLADDARDALATVLVPRATVVTPNIPEARVLTQRGDAGPEELALAALELGPDAAVVTGGHSEGGSDFYAEAGAVTEIPGKRHPGGAAHGSGCTHSSTLAAYLARGHEPLDAAREARRVAGEAVRDGLREVGEGAGPVDVLGIAARSQPPGREIPF
jgi:hydroxymethylpyrimidine/phosphomethylpyrimidine kinase